MDVSPVAGGIRRVYVEMWVTMSLTEGEDPDKAVVERELLAIQELLDEQPDSKCKLWA